MAPPSPARRVFVPPRYQGDRALYPLHALAFEADGDGMEAEMLRRAGENRGAVPTADLEALDFQGFTPLMRAAGNAGAACVGALIAAGAAVDHAASSGRTALHHAAEAAHAEQVGHDADDPRTAGLLLAGGADQQATDEWGWTGADLARHFVRPSVHSFLLEAAEDPDAHVTAFRLELMRVRARLEEPLAEACGNADKAMAVGTRIAIAGHGRGEFVAFNSRLFGPNEFSIRMDSASHATADRDGWAAGEVVVIKLKQQIWTVREADMQRVEETPVPTKSKKKSKQKQKQAKKGKKDHGKLERSVTGLQSWQIGSEVGEEMAAVKIQAGFRGARVRAGAARQPAAAARQATARAAAPVVPLPAPAPAPREGADPPMRLTKVRGVVAFRPKPPTPEPEPDPEPEPEPEPEEKESDVVAIDRHLLEALEAAREYVADAADGSTLQELFLEADEWCREVVPGWRPASTQLTIRFNPRSNHNVVIDVALKETKDERRAVTKVVYRNRDWGFRDRMLETNVVWIDVHRRLGAQSAAFLQQFADSGVEFLPSCYGMEAGRSVMERIRGSDLFMAADCTTQKDRWASDYVWLTGAPVSFAFPRNSPACAVTMAAVGRALGQLHSYPLDWLDGRDIVLPCPSGKAPAFTTFTHGRGVGGENPICELLFPDGPNRSCPSPAMTAFGTADGTASALYDRCRALVPRTGLWSDVVTVHGQPCSANIIYADGEVRLIDWDDVALGRRVQDLLGFLLPGGVCHFAGAESMRAFGASYLHANGLLPEDSDEAVSALLFELQCAVPFFLLHFPTWHHPATAAVWAEHDAHRAIKKMLGEGGSTTAFVVGLAEKACAVLEHSQLIPLSKMRREIGEKGVIAKVLEEGLQNRELANREAALQRVRAKMSAQAE